MRSNLGQQENAYPTAGELEGQISKRRRQGKLWRTLFMAATLLAILVLLVLLVTIINQSFGLVAVQMTVPPESLITVYQNEQTAEGANAAGLGEIDELAELPREALIDILAANVSRGLGRRLEREQVFFEDRTVFEDPAFYNQLCQSDQPPEGCFYPVRSQEDVLQLVQEYVVKPTVVESWFLFESIRNRSDIKQQVQETYPGAVVEFRTWLTPDFIESVQSSTPELAGVRTAILGTLWVIIVTVAVAFPLGVGAAIYLEEYADRGKWYNQIIQTNISNLAGVPSIIYGMLGLVVFVRALEPLTSGALFGAVDASSTANGRTVLSAGLTLALLILPVIIISAQEAIRAVPSSLRQASYGLGATRWQTIWHHVLPNALPGILTGAILSISRAIGETAPLVVVGASTFITVDPSGPFSKFTVLPIQIFQWTTRPQGAFRNIAAAAIIILLVLLLSLNAVAVIMRNRSSKKLV